MPENERIDKMTVPHLRELAKGMGVVGTTGMKKEDLIREIVALKPELAPPAEKAHHKVVVGREGKDAASLKKGRMALKKRIAEAVAGKDLAAARALRRQKKHARRLIKKARLAGIIKPEEAKKKEEAPKA